MDRNGFALITQDTPVAHVRVGAMEIALLASGHGVEVMRHRMQRNATWTILQETELGEFQYYLITEGRLH